MRPKPFTRGAAIDQCTADHHYPRTTNKILEAYLKAKGVAAEDNMINDISCLFSIYLCAARSERLLRT